MAKIQFAVDILQDSEIAALQTSKVETTVFNSTVNSINTTITDNYNTLTTNINTVQTNLDNAVQSLKDNEIATLNSAVALLNADQSTEGSVDYKIKQSLDALVNGAPEAFDTLKEIVDWMQQEDTDLSSFIDQVNGKVDALKGSVSETYDNLGKVETKLNSIDAEIADINSKLTTDTDTIMDSIPTHIVDTELPISDDNKITLNKVPFGSIYQSRVTVYHTDADGNTVIDGFYPISVDTDDATGKTYIISVGDDSLTSDQKAMLDYDYRPIDNQ